MQGFQLQAGEAMSVIDAFNEVSNNYAISSSGIGEALKRSAAAFNAANTDLNQSIALITAGNEIVQSPEKVGTMWQTVSARIRGTKAELEELGEETDNILSSSKLRDLVNGYTGLDIMEDEDTYKDMYTIIKEIGEVWNDLEDVEQAALLEALAGKKQSNTLAAVLANYERLEDIYQTAEGSAGSAMREQERYTESLQYSLDQLTAHGEEFWNTLINKDDVKSFINLINDLISAATVLVDTFGAIPTLALGLGVAKGIENFDSIKGWINGVRTSAGNMSAISYADDAATLALYKQQLEGLTLTQQKLALSSTNLSAAEQAKILAYMQESAVVGQITAADIAKLTVEQQGVLVSAGVIASTGAETAGTVVLTQAMIDQIKVEAIKQGMDEKQLLLSMGITAANIKQAGSMSLLKGGFKSLLKPIKEAWASTEGMGGTLKRLGGTAKNLWSKMSGTGKVAIIAAIVIAVNEAISMFVDSTEEIKAKIEESKQKISETESEISSLDSQISQTESLIQKMKEAGADDSTIKTYEKERDLLREQKHTRKNLSISKY